jgi:hypothetical protein
MNSDTDKNDGITLFHLSTGCPWPITMAAEVETLPLADAQA